MGAIVTYDGGATLEDNAIYVRVTTEDGYFIYSSPIHIEKKA